MKFTTIYILIAVLLLLTTNAASQQEEKVPEEMKKQINVVRAFDPIISDAFKINDLPNILDTIRTRPEFNYFLSKFPMSTGFQVNPIKPAKMIGEPLTKLYNSYFKVGVGYPIIPLLEGYYNNLRNEDFSYGAGFNHISGIGKIKLDNGQKEKANFHRTNLELYGKKIFDYSIFDAKAYVNSRGNRLYGYRDTIIDLDEDLSKQSWYTLGSNFRLKSTHLDSTHINYVGQFGINTSKDNFAFKESEIFVSGGLDKFWDGSRVGVDLDIYHFAKSKTLDTTSNTVVKLSPWISLFGEKWRAVAGISLASDKRGDDSKTHIYPRGNLQFDIVSHYIIPYIEIGGYLERNNYMKILNENPYINPGLNVQNTNHKMILTGGLKGNFNKNISYNLTASYSLVDSMYLYTNDYSNRLGNTFNVDYDNAEKTSFRGELIVKASNKVKAHFFANYYKYKMENQEKAWHRPGWDATFSLEYNLKNKIYIKTDIFAMGEMYANSFDPAYKWVKLDNIIDANLSLEYRYTKILSGFIQLNNLTASKNYYYANYPSHGFSIMLGITYAM